MLDDFESAYPDNGVRRKRSRRGAAVAAAAAPSVSEGNEPEEKHASSSSVIADANRRADEQGRLESSFIDDADDDPQSDDFGAINIQQAEGAGGPDGPDVVPPPPEREYVSLVRLSEACIAADNEATDDEDFCFRCMIGKQMRARNSSTHLESMDELIRTQYMFMSPDELTKRVQHMYNVNLRQSIECEAMRKPWRRRVIWEHIHRHALTPDMATKYHLRVMGSTLEVLTTEGLVYKGATPGALKVDVQNLKVYTSMIKEYLRGLALVTEAGSAQAAAASSRLNKRVGR